MRTGIVAALAFIAGAALVALLQQLPLLHSSAATLRAAVTAASSVLALAQPRRRYLTTQEAVQRLYTPAGHGHLAAADLEPERLALFTAEAQAIIYAHQHPRTCTGAKYLVAHAHMLGVGIGSIMHVTGYQLAVALETGRIFVWASSTGGEWTDPHTCAHTPKHPHSFLCHFRAHSNCTLAHAMESDYLEVREFSGVAGLPSAFVPSVFVRALLSTHPGMKDDELKYWWRAQSVGYLMRMNADTVAALRAMRMNASMHIAGGVVPQDVHSHMNSHTHVLPRGTIHAHVRHGDKFTEMTLQPTKKYFAAAEGLVRNLPLSLRRFLFISTEDSDVITQAMGTYNGTWSILYSDIPRSNSGPYVQIRDLGEDRAGVTTRTHLLQLLMSLEADAWVTTRGSNWNRLLDELRCVWVDKCTYSIVDIGTEVSSANYNW